MVKSLAGFFKGMSLLYAEDEMISRTLYEDYFKAYFKIIYVAKNGQEALDFYTEKRPDILILDINMPILNGLDVCKAVRAKDKKTKIIVLSARTDKEALLEAIELGLTTYLEKPLKKEQLEEALNKLAEELGKSTKVLLRQMDDNSYFWDTKKRELLLNSEIIALTKKEKLLLELLVNTHHDKITYQHIYDTVWFEDYNAEYYSELSIKSLIKKLRAKLPKNTIKNSYGLGYYLLTPE